MKTRTRTRREECYSSSERERERKKSSKRHAKKEKRLSFFWFLCVNCFVGVFCWLKKKERRQTHENTRVVRSSNDFCKKAKKGEKRRKRISLPHNTFL
jgi:hypothetical protein